MLADRPAAARALMGCALLAVLALVPARGQMAGADGARLSKQMRLAIDQYRRGDDMGAMDRFMEVLVKGDPTERSMANDYLNKITQRMAGSGKIEPEAPRPSLEAEPVPPRRGEREDGVSPRAPVETYEPPPAVRTEGPDGRSDEPPPSDRERDREEAPSRSQGGASEDRRVMKEEIDAKLKNRTREVLGSLRKWEEVQVRMANSRLPRAVGFRSSFLFDEGTRFKKESAKVLEALSELVFSLGATQVVILPEGALFNDAKIMDMRRTMAISSALMKAGVAPARLRVNLLSAQVDVPKDLNDWRGILILFVYNQPLNLATENDLEAGGPPVSLGVSPASLDPREGEGAIVEFSVMEPAQGLMSWRFQLLSPGAKPEEDMKVLQEVKGSAPVFHQIYWNARKRYFGEPLPPGRYECVLTATDMRNRTSRARQWVEVKGDAPAPEATAGKAPPPTLGTPSEVDIDPEDELDVDPKARPKAGKKGGTRLSAKGKAAKAGPKSRKGKPSRVKRRPASSVAAAEVPKADEPSADTGAAPLAADGTAPSKHNSVELKGQAKPAEDASSRAMAVNYQVLFQKGTTNITKEGESILARVADTMHYYPLDNINLVGYAYSGEPDAAKLAGKRAEYVSKLLVDRHAMKSERIRTDTKVTEDEAFKVEIYIVEGQ